MARKKKTKQKKISFGFGAGKGKKHQFKWPNFATTIKIISAVCIVAGVMVTFVLLEKYVYRVKAVSQKPAILKLVNVPNWANDTLKEKIYTAAAASDEELKLDDTVARRVHQDIESNVFWLDEIKVQVTNENLVISARWRKPLVLVKAGLHRRYIDKEMVVLDFVPMPDLPIVRVNGLSGLGQLPLPGKTWESEDLRAAVRLIEQLDKMDKRLTADKPLLSEIASMNVSNFDGRETTRAPHIVLYTKDDTEIIWGAKLGAWQRYLEASDEEKLAKLYSYYKEHGSLLGGAKYINLRDPQEITLPADKY